MLTADKCKKNIGKFQTFFRFYTEKIPKSIFFATFRLHKVRKVCNHRGVFRETWQPSGFLKGFVWACERVRFRRRKSSF